MAEPLPGFTKEKKTDIKERRRLRTVVLHEPVLPGGAGERGGISKREAP